MVKKRVLLPRQARMRALEKIRLIVAHERVHNESLTVGPHCCSLGYHIMRKAIRVNHADIRQLRRCFLQPDTSHIFNNSGDNDEKRRQTTSLDRDQSNLVTKIENLVTLEFPGYHTTDVVGLFSLAGCKEQQPHADYNPHTFAENPAPMGLLLCVEKHASLIVYPGSHLFIRNKTAHIPPTVRRVVIALNQGDVLFFRGDLVHAGAAYETSSNLRMHAFIDHSTVERGYNETFLRFSNKALRKITRKRSKHT